MADIPYNGANWVKSNEGLTNPSIICFAVSNDNQIITGTGGGIFRSRDDGKTWARIYAGGADTIISALAFNKSGHIFAGALLTTAFQGGIIRSTDEGKTWQEVMPYRSDDFVTSFVLNDAGEIFAAAFRSGVFRSSDNGQSWHHENSGLLRLNVNTLALDSKGFMFAGTRGNGVFRSSASTAVAERSDKNIPATFDLKQNYPNPFNPATMIEFSIPVQSRVTIKIIEASGREFAVLADRNFPPGSHRITWNASQIASGVYFCRMTAGNFTQIRKLLLLH